MPLSRFLFDTYPGFFVLALPFAAAAWGLAWAFSARQRPLAPRSRRLCRSFFAAYLTGLFLLTLLLDPLRVLWYRALYGRGGLAISWLGGSFDPVPHPAKWLHDRESITNILAFLPFGALHPPAQGSPSLGKTVFAGFLCSLAIELLQPIVGRACDVNDLILNTLGALVSALCFFGFRALRRRKKLI